MRVAIVGAGPSGLACALALEQRGIYPDIFERSHRVGLPMPAVAAMMQLFNRTRQDQLNYLEQNFGLRIRPLARLRRVVMHTARRIAAVKGDLGYLVERGQGPNAVEVQLSEQLRSKIKFDIQANYRALAGEYDYVVVADGSSLAARDLGVWKITLSAWVKGAIILGRYNPETVVMYFNTAYARHGFALLAPFNRERAVLLLAVPDTERTELSNYWDRFLDHEKLHPEIVEIYEWHHVSGITSRQRVNNVFLVGNSGGFTDSFLGLGLFNGMTGAALAARAIAEELDYERMVRPIMSRINSMLTLREAFNTLDDGGIDRLVRFLTLPVVKHIVYHSNVDFVRLMVEVVKRKNPLQTLLRLPAAKKNKRQ